MTVMIFLVPVPPLLTDLELLQHSKIRGIFDPAMNVLRKQSWLNSELRV
jgi:hypothetical protein